MDKQKKKILINIAKFIFFFSLGVEVVLSHKNSKNINTEKQITLADEIEKNQEMITLNDSSSAVYMSDELELIIQEIKEEIDEENTKEILDEQLDQITDKMVYETEKEYSGMNLSHEYEDYLKDLCLEYSKKNNIDYDMLYKALMTIGYQESAGKWDNNGIKSSTDDLGEFQINTCHLDEAYRKYGYTEDDLKNDKYKNARYAVDFICEIMNNKNCESIEDIFGIYNGWVGWKNKEPCIKYSNSCMEIMNEYFSEKSNVK